MGLLELIVVLAVVGFVVWIVIQIPMPVVVRNVIIGLVGLYLILWTLQSLGLVGSLNFPRLR